MTNLSHHCLCSFATQNWKQETSMNINYLALKYEYYLRYMCTGYCNIWFDMYMVHFCGKKINIVLLCDLMDVFGFQTGSTLCWITKHINFAIWNNPISVWIILRDKDNKPTLMLKIIYFIVKKHPNIKVSWVFFIIQLYCYNIKHVILQLHHVFYSCSS